MKLSVPATPVLPMVFHDGEQTDGMHEIISTSDAGIAEYPSKRLVIQPCANSCKYQRRRYCRVPHPRGDFRWTADHPPGVARCLPEYQYASNLASAGRQTIRQAVARCLPDVPHQLCHFHYLDEAAEPIFEADRHAKTELKKLVRGVRPIERSLEGGEDEQTEATCKRMTAPTTCLPLGRRRGRANRGDAQLL